MTKTKLADGHRHVGVRLPDGLFAAVEKHLEKMRITSAPGVELKLADALRNLIALGLDAARAKAS